MSVVVVEDLDRFVPEEAPVTVVLFDLDPPSTFFPFRLMLLRLSCSKRRRFRRVRGTFLGLFRGAGEGNELANFNWDLFAADELDGIGNC